VGLGSIEAGTGLYAARVTEPHPAESEDWDAVARAVSARLTETRMTQMDVASRAQVSLTTLRELQHNLNPRRRRPQTLAAISEALGWSADHLEQVLRSGQPPSPAAELNDPILRAIDDLTAEVRELRDRVEDLEQRSIDEDGQP
jgi:hypothetical protein